MDVTLTDAIQNGWLLRVMDTDPADWDHNDRDLMEELSKVVEGQIHTFTVYNRKCRCFPFDADKNAARHKAIYRTEPKGGYPIGLLKGGRFG